MKNERKITFLPVEATAQVLEEIFDRSRKDMEGLMTEKDRAILIKKDDETIPLIVYREPEEYGEFIKSSDKEK